jgi:YidC/Oxa1 family membrane protein insertase
MDIRRVVLYAGLAWVVFSLWNYWQIDYPAKAPRVSVATKSTRLPPSMVASGTTNSGVIPLATAADADQALIDTAKTIRVQTDVLDLSIDLAHGDITQANLLDYPENMADKNKPFVLLENTPSQRYIAKSNLFVVDGQKIQDVTIDYTSQYEDYKLAGDQTKLVVTLVGKTTNGLLLHKDFIFTKNSYLIDVRYSLMNQGSMPWKGYMNMQLMRSSPKEDKSSMFHVGSYTGASYSNPGKTRYKKVDFNAMTKENLDLNVEGGWIAMQQHYFLTAWVPTPDSTNHLYTQAVNGDYTIGAFTQPIELRPSEKKEVSSRLYLGPEVTNVLKAIAPGLDLTVDYGWLWFLSALLFSVMKAIYSVLGNWGWSIVLITVLVKLAFYRLSATSYKSMAGMRKLQPKLQALRERYGDDKAKISQGTMELYKQEKVNPLGGCLPIVIQIPVFIALYWVLLESVELRQAPFIFWIKDLATADPYHILPVIMGGTMLIQQKLNPAPPDPMQAKIMMFLPVLFTGLFWSFPSGLVLYWIVNNSLSILQQWYITRKFSDDKPKKGSKLLVAK